METLTSSILMSELIWLPHFASQCNFLIDVPSAKTLKSQHSYMWKILKTSDWFDGLDASYYDFFLFCGKYWFITCLMDCFGLLINLGMVAYSDSLAMMLA